MRLAAILLRLGGLVIAAAALSWLGVLMAVSCTYGMEAGGSCPRWFVATMNGRMAAHLWYAVWVPLHLAAAAWIAGARI